MFDDDDDFASNLREKSTRTTAVYEEVDDIPESGGGILARFTPTQRLILAALALLDVVVIALVVLVIAGIINL